MRFDRTGSRLLVFAGALALALPIPAAAQTVITLGLCNGGTLSIPIRQDGGEKKPGKDCRTACHASDRRQGSLRSTRTDVGSD